jgi:hypothetical protein
MTFELFALRFRFSALGSIYFPPGKAGNIIRGALGVIFRKFVCTPNCPGAKSCGQRSSCAYARLFEPTALGESPSGLGDWPRPFVVRAAHLDGQRFASQEQFHFDLFVFEMHDPALAYFAFAFSQLMREGLGPGRPGAELTAIHSLEDSGKPGELVFDGKTLLNPTPLTLALEGGEPASRAIIRFVTPTELKGGGQVLREPEFGVLFARVRDRIHMLRQLYGRGPLPLDFRAMGERARAVKLVRSSLQWENWERRSSKTGQRHPLGGFVGEAEYEGELAEFVPYLKVASWTGVGRQTTWGKGYIQTSIAG